MPLCKLHKLNMVLFLTVSLAPSPHVATCCFPVCFLQLVLTHPCGVGCCFVRQRHLSMVHVFLWTLTCKCLTITCTFCNLICTSWIVTCASWECWTCILHSGPSPSLCVYFAAVFFSVATHLSNFAFDACCQVSRVDQCDLFVFS
jgi:hypothetical protein